MDHIEGNGTTAARGKAGTLNVRLSADLLRAIDEARADGQTRTEVAIELLTVGLQYRAENGEAGQAVSNTMEELATVGADRDAAVALAAERLAVLRAILSLLSSRTIDDAMAMLVGSPALPETSSMGAAFRVWLNQLNFASAATPARVDGLAVDAPMRARMENLALAMSGSGILGELGITASVDHVARLALSRGLAVLEGAPVGGAMAPVPVLAPYPPRPVAPSYAQPAPEAPPRPRPPAGAYARAMPVTQEQLDNRPTRHSGWMASSHTSVAETHGDFDDKMADVPQGVTDVTHTAAGLLEPDPSWRPWAPDVDGEIAPDEVPLHTYYHLNGWYRWARSLPDGRVMTFYWSDDPRAQAIETFKGTAGLVVEALATGSRGTAHAIAAIQR